MLSLPDGWSRASDLHNVLLSQALGVAVGSSSPPAGAQKRSTEHVGFGFCRTEVIEIRPRKGPPCRPVGLKLRSFRPWRLQRAHLDKNVEAHGSWRSEAQWQQDPDSERPE